MVAAGRFDRFLYEAERHGRADETGVWITDAHGTT
jgi:hypothetical protein